MIWQSEAFLGLIDVAIVSAALVAMLFAVVCITVGLFKLWPKELADAVVEHDRKMLASGEASEEDVSIALDSG
jgi:hypothetical protein